MTFIKRLFKNDYFLSFFFLFLYLCTNSYIFAWDDQHLEVPLLKHYIDPTLYKGDYYVETLAKNFTSYLYPLLAKFIRTDQVEGAYLVLFLLVRFGMFFWVFRLFMYIAKDRWSAAMAVLMFFLTGRTEEFLYRTFSHQNFSFVFVFCGLYLFYRERFLLAAMVWGLGANFHALFNLFPMLYMSAYILFCRKDRFLLLLKSGAVFVLCAMPFLLWHFSVSLNRGHHEVVDIKEWFPLYIKGCYQNFIFGTVNVKAAMHDPATVWIQTQRFVFLFCLYVMLVLLHVPFRQDKKAHAIVWCAYALVLFSFIFTDLHPNRTVIDLNLVRNEYFIRFFLMGYIAFFSCRLAYQGTPVQALLGGLLFFVVGFNNFDLFALKLRHFWYVPAAQIIMFFLLLIKNKWNWLRKLMILVPLAAAFISFVFFHYQFLQMKNHGGGMWQMYRSWIDMQKYVKAHTFKDALIMAPYDTEYGGFRVFSERKVLVCYRDCGIIGFDYNAAVEWEKRIKDIDGFKMYTNDPPRKAVINAILKYKVDYIVFMNYYQPGDNGMLKKLYQNEVLALYQVIRPGN